MTDLYNPKENLVNVANSVLKHYGAKTFHPSYKPLDNVLEGNKGRKVCILLLDGFGTSIQNIFRRSCPFIYSHRFFKITSVFPPTTVAATTSLLTGLYPKETGWLGWEERFPDEEKAVVTFHSEYSDGGGKMARTSEERLPTKKIIELIKEKGYKAGACMGFDVCENLNPDPFFAKADQTIKNNDFTYAYWMNPDADLHEYGVHAREIKKCVKDLDRLTKKLCDDNKDCLFIILADHGHIDNELVDINDYPDFVDLLSYKWITIEGRAASFYVEKNNREAFRKKAGEYFGKDFYLLTKKQVISKNVFGLGKACEQFEGLLGDFLLIAKSNKTLWIKGKAVLKSNHAGATPNERYINIAIGNADGLYK